MKGIDHKFSTYNILVCWDLLGIVLRLWILIFHRHFAKKLLEGTTLLAGQVESTIGFLGTCAVSTSGKLCSCHRKRRVPRNCSAYAPWCQGTSVDTVGSKEVQTLEGDIATPQSLLCSLI